MLFCSYDIQNMFFQRRKIVFDRIMDSLNINTKVIMYEDVTKSRSFFPFSLRIYAGDYAALFGYLRGRFYFRFLQSINRRTHLLCPTKYQTLCQVLAIDKS